MDSDNLPVLEPDVLGLNLLLVSLLINRLLVTGRLLILDRVLLILLNRLVLSRCLGNHRIEELAADTTGCPRNPASGPRRGFLHQCPSADANG